MIAIKKVILTMDNVKNKHLDGIEVKNIVDFFGRRNIKNYKAMSYLALLLLCKNILFLILILLTISNT